MADPAPETNTTSQTAPDPEVVAIGKVNEALASLEPVVRARVLRWAVDRFSVTLPHEKKTSHGGEKEKAEEKHEPEQPDSFDDFASLYDAANPTTEADKALVAGYWLQVVQQNTDWNGFSANKELKHLGHGVDNITIALSSLIDAAPNLVMQTHKSGTTKQARKKYKVTGAGIKRVKQMLSGSAPEGANGG